MKKRTFRIVSLLLTAAMLFTLLAACGGKDSGSTSTGSTGGDTSSSTTADPGKTYELSFTIHDPAASAKTQKYEALAAATKEATNGAVNITVYPGGTLVASTDVAEGVLSRSADIGWLFTTFFPGQFPLTEVVSLPMTFTDSIVSTKTLNALYEQSPDLQAELSKYKLLNMYCNPINYVYSNDPVYTVEDMKGQQLRAPSGVPTDMITAWGGTPVLMGPGDVYQSVEKGVLTGCTFEWSGFDDFKLYEVIKSCTEIPVYCGIFLTAMNQESFNELPAEYQAVIEEIWMAPEVATEFAQVFMNDFEGAYANAEAAGMEIIVPDEATLDGFRVLADAYINDWVAKNTTDSFDAQAYLDLMYELRDGFQG